MAGAVKGDIGWPLWPPGMASVAFLVSRGVWMAQWHDGRVIAIGDCGHGMSPQRVQGANHHSVAALSGLKTGWLSGRLDLSRYDPPDDEREA